MTFVWTPRPNPNAPPPGEFAALDAFDHTSVILDCTADGRHVGSVQVFPNATAGYWRTPGAVATATPTFRHAREAIENGALSRPAV